MSLFSGIKKIIKPLVNIPKWIDYRYLSATNRKLFSSVKNFFVPQKSKIKETFEEAVSRLKVTDTDLVERIREFRRLMRLWIFLFFVCISYSIYLLIEHSFRGFFPCLGLSFVIITQVFRYHFWIFQIKHRRLGCTLYDWFNTYFFSRNKTL